jgi:hypothetical protein
MARCRLDAQDRAALRALDDGFVISADGETATVAGEMEITLVRPADDGGARFWLKITFPNNETLDVRIRRSQLLQELDVTFLRQQELEDVKLQLRQELDVEADDKP